MTRIKIGLLYLLFFTAVIVYAWPTPTVYFYVLVALHLLAGLVFLGLLLFLLAKRQWNAHGRTDVAGWSLLVLGGVLGVILAFTGAERNDFPLLYTHIGLCVAGIVLLLGGWAARRGWLRSVAFAGALRWGILVLAFASLSYGAWWLRTIPWENGYKIVNPPIAPATMNQEGGGSSGPFFPASAQVLDHEKIPKQYFLDSKTCQPCHADIYREWKSSAHHFSSFNNQWYRKSIEYMQDTVGIRPSKWCAGCHDPALLLTGMFDKPVREIENTPEGQAGLGCIMCHSIVRIDSTMGQNNYVLEYPHLNDLATSKNPVVHDLVDYLIELNPEPHRRVFLKPFVRNQTAKFCSVCHKVHLDFPVNHYRWVRGFDDYDNWQASGVSGLGARSFYYPPHPEVCTDCHMPEVRSHDFGNIHGFINSHRFPAANTALAYENEDTKQLETVENFLKAEKVTVDIFGISPEQPVSGARRVTPLGPRPGAAPQLQTAFAVGEESEFVAPRGAQQFATPATELTAPFGRFPVRVRRGETVRLDVVVRTRGVGHFFPGGTVDAFDLWVELKAVDNKGHVIFWSGRPEGPKGTSDGPVDPGAQFYRALLVDAHGNPINKRNAWAERAVIYVHLIPPGAADTVHYRLHIPEDAGDRITITAKLNYRKFDWWFTQFAFAGVHDPSQHDPAVSPDYDDTKWVFTGSTKGHSGKRPGIPDLPIVVMSEAKAELHVLPRHAPEPKPHVEVEAADWERWNDYGIGLLLQGDLQGADAAFAKVAKAAPNRPDGWVNMARARFAEGNLPAAEKVVLRALQVAPSLASAHFFYGQVLRDQGHYQRAITQYEAALKQYPTDRVVRNSVGRTYFLERRYAQAVREFKKVIAIDPENVEANYNLMLCYTGMRKPDQARQFEIRYLRFKANEAEGSLTGPYLRSHPDENNERQPIHEITSGVLTRPAYSSGHPRKSEGSR